MHHIIIIRIATLIIGKLLAATIIIKQVILTGSKLILNQVAEKNVKSVKLNNNH